MNMETSIKKQKIGDWISKKDVMSFLGYKETQMREFMINNANILRVSRIGKRSFITESSLLKVLEEMATN
jgi:hypothetical protein